MMKIHWYGHSCFKITAADGTAVLTDPYDPSTGRTLSGITVDGILSSHDHFDHAYAAACAGEPAFYTLPGSYTVGSIKAEGFASFHDHHQGAHRGKNTIFSINVDGMNIVHLGDLGHIPEDEVLDRLKGADLLMIPVGGGFTVTTEEAAAITAAIAPKAVIPMHYMLPWLGFTIGTADAFVEAAKRQVVRLDGADLEISSGELQQDSLILFSDEQ